MSTSTTLWTTFTHDLRLRRDRRARTRRLRTELAAYRTPAEIEDLLVTIDAHERGDGVVDGEIIRGILYDNLGRYYADQAPLRRPAHL